MAAPVPASPRISAKPQGDSLATLHREIVDCRKCARLVEHCQAVAREKRRAFMDWDYWGRPVPPFGDPLARLLILGLAPAAHGGNRTGRMFTGDRSGDFLFAALHRAGFANQAGSAHRDDGLQLKDAYVTASVRCAPPDNKPTPEEQQNCRAFLERELRLLPNVRVVLALGKLAFDTFLRILKDSGRIESPASYRFGHGACYKLPGGLPRLFASYHPSQQNTFTGRLTERMFDDLMCSIRRALAR